MKFGRLFPFLRRAGSCEGEEAGETMHASIRHNKIQILEVEPLTKEVWDSLLDELKAERASWMQHGERVSILQDKNGRANASIWRNPSLSDEEIICILGKYGIEGSVVPHIMG